MVGYIGMECFRLAWQLIIQPRPTITAITVYASTILSPSQPWHLHPSSRRVTTKVQHLMLDSVQCSTLKIQETSYSLRHFHSWPLLLYVLGPTRAHRGHNPAPTTIFQSQLCTHPLLMRLAHCLSALRDVEELVGPYRGQCIRVEKA